MKTDTGPSNCIFDGDPNEKTEVRQWYKCSKCKEKIWTHLYNEHVHNCSRQKMLAKKVEAEQKTKQPVAKQRLVNRPSFGSTRSRHRKRPPIRR